MELPSKIRAFVAVRLSAEADRALIDLIAELRAPSDGVSWARRDNLHLTLRFLGAAVDSKMIPPLADRLRDVAQRTTPFVVDARGLGAFPDLERPRVIWAALESEALLTLARCVEEAAVACGFEPERRPYSAHLTLGRVRSLRGWKRARPKLEAASERDFGRSRIETMTLYESRLSPSGASYREIGEFKFAPQR